MNFQRGASAGLKIRVGFWPCHRATRTRPHQDAWYLVPASAAEADAIDSGIQKIDRQSGRRGAGCTNRSAVGPVLDKELAAVGGGGRGRGGNRKGGL